MKTDLAKGTPSPGICLCPISPSVPRGKFRNPSPLIYRSNNKGSHIHKMQDQSKAESQAWGNLPHQKSLRFTPPKPTSPSAPHSRATQTSVTQTGEGEGEFSNLRLSQKQCHSLKERDVVGEGGRGSQITFAFSFGLFLGLPLLCQNNDQFKGPLFFLESPMTQNSQQLWFAGWIPRPHPKHSVNSVSL